MAPPQETLAHSETTDGGLKSTSDKPVDQSSQPTAAPANGRKAGDHEEEPEGNFADGEAYDDEEGKDGNPRERRKIEIKFILNKARRHITFSKRKHGIMKKAWELSVLTGTQVLLLVVSETGLVYTFTTPKLQPLVTQSEGKNLIQACLNAPETAGDAESPDEDAGPVESDVVAPSPAASVRRPPQRPDTMHNPVQSPPTATENIGNLLDPSNNPGYANVLAARRAEEANQQRLAQVQQQQQQIQRQSMHAQQQQQQQQIQMTGAPPVIPNGSAPPADAAGSPQPGSTAANPAAAAALQAQALAVSGLPPHLQPLAQGYKAPVQFGYGGYPFAVPNQFGMNPLGGQFPGQLGTPLDATTLLALQQQQQQQQHPQPQPPATQQPQPQQAPSRTSETNYGRTDPSASSSHQQAHYT